jgi:hypothetical protein
MEEEAKHRLRSSTIREEEGKRWAFGFLLGGGHGCRESSL